jgi:hypothetical protein
MIATPMYGGMARSEYISSVGELTMALVQAGHEVMQTFTVNESLITRARNGLAHQFLLSDCEALLFIDADHGFNAADVLKMVQSGKDLIGAAYPMKAINWDAVRYAALLGKEDLDRYSGYFAFNTLDEQGSFESDEPYEVKNVGTGMMLITRKVFDEMRPHCQTYRGNTIGAIDQGDEIVEFFNTEIEPEHQTLLSEDYAFCARWRRLGNSVYVAPWVRITHLGHHAFTGSLVHLLSLNNELSEAMAREAAQEPAQEPAASETPAVKKPQDRKKKQ